MLHTEQTAPHIILEDHRKSLIQLCVSFDKDCISISLFDSLISQCPHFNQYLPILVISLYGIPVLSTLALLKMVVVHADKNVRLYIRCDGDLAKYNAMRLSVLISSSHMRIFVLI